MRELLGLSDAAHGVVAACRTTKTLKAQDKVLALCKALGRQHSTSMPSAGWSSTSARLLPPQGVELKFHKREALVEYPQFGAAFQFPGCPSWMC